MNRFLVDWIVQYKIDKVPIIDFNDNETKQQVEITNNANQFVTDGSNLNNNDIKQSNTEIETTMIF